MIVGLEHVAALERAVVGSKAAHLARALARGFAVPPGFVVPVGVNPSAVEVLAAVNDLGGPFAVRSSALAEDLVEASYAGLYESYLNVSAADVPEAIRSCRGSGDAERVNAYRDPESEAGVAVLVQRMVPASAAGVAFTANPLTGARDETIVTAVTGLGESLVAGEAVGEEWFIRDGNAHLTRSADVLELRQAVAIAELARRAAEMFDGPQDIEWAIAGGDLHLLQARPMTALPDPVTWPVPGRGLWVSNFRIGEWLPDPVTPLFGDWLLPLLDDGFRQGMQETAGSSVPFGYALVNDWYYSQPNPSFSHLPAAILRSRGRILRFMVNALVRPGRDPEGAAQSLLDGLYSHWKYELLPAYRDLAATRIADRSSTELTGLIEDIARTAGRHLWYLAVVGGAAWKMESCLRRFLDHHGLADVEVPLLLRGLDGHDTEGTGHAVYSLDWFHPTATATPPRSGTQRTDRHKELRTERQHVEQTCRAALAARKRLLGKWDAMLGTAQRYALIREEQASQLTLGWPLLRACANLLGETLTTAGVTDQPDELYFLTRPEISQVQPLGPTARERQRRWQRERHLIPPLVLGAGPPLIGRHLEHTLGISRADQQDNVLTGQPASPGIATGPARIVRGAEDFDRVKPGDVLIARVTAPAWTPLFNTVVAVVTDGGTLAAHASLIAREYGIPAVVATGSATRRIKDGHVVTVDGGRGVVSLTGR